MKYLKLIRVKHYVKNFFIFIPIFFAGQIFTTNKIDLLLISFFSFCFAASTIYIINDIKDIEEDRMHPKKSKRPLANGDISKKQALFFVPFLIISSLFLAYNVNREVFFLVLAYFLLNLLYTFYLKKIPILDITIVSFFFILRIFVGGFAADIVLSKWIVLMVFLLSMGLVLGKRYDDLLLTENDKDLNLRKSLYGYNLEFTKLATLSVFIMFTICYTMFAVSPDIEQQLNSKYIYLTSIPVIVGVLRYLNIIIVEQKSGSPTDVFLKDRFIQIVLLIWVMALSFLYYI